MKKLILTLVLALIIGLAVGCSESPQNTETVNEDAGAEDGSVMTNVICVVDGDTIKVLYHGEEVSVRLIGVDTPETVHPTKAVQAYGQEASDFTKSKLTGKDVRLEFDVEKQDQYDRLLAYVWLGDSMFNEVLVAEGYAQVSTYPPNVKYVERFTAAQKTAREAGKGLWGLESDQGTAAPVETITEENGKIKGNINSRGEKIYHVPGGVYYNNTKPEEWFDTEEHAQAAGYRRSSR